MSRSITDRNQVSNALHCKYLGVLWLLLQQLSHYSLLITVLYDCLTLAGTLPSVQTVSDVCLKCICSLDTSAFSALEVLDDNQTIQFYLLTCSCRSCPVLVSVHDFRLYYVILLANIDAILSLVKTHLHGCLHGELMSLKQSLSLHTQSDVCQYEHVMPFLCKCKAADQHRGQHGP